MNYSFKLLRLVGIISLVIFAQGFLFGQDVVDFRNPGGEGESPFYENVIRVKIEDRAIADVAPAIDQGVAVSGIESIDMLNMNFNAVSMERIFRDGGKFEERRRRHGLHRWYEIRFSGEPNIQVIANAYSADANIEIASPIPRKMLHVDPEFNEGSDLPADLLQFQPNDPLYDSQWAFNNTGQTGGSPGADISAEMAWEIQTGDSVVVVSVHDSGIDLTHPDVMPNIWWNPDPDPNLNDIHGWNFADNNNNLQDINGHGTHVTGTVAAVTNNAVGVAGTAGGDGTEGSGVRFMVTRIIGAGNNFGGIPESYAYAADNGAVISQNSWGYTLPNTYDPAVLDAIDYFIENAGYDADGNPVGPIEGGIVIFSAGNSRSNAPYYPGYHDPVYAIASTDHNDVLSDHPTWGSNYGYWIDISAPGSSILSTYIGGGYAYASGTSMASPHVSGAAGLVASQYPDLTNDQVMARILAGADDIDQLNPGYEGQLGAGRLNAHAALMEDDGLPPAPITDLEVIGVLQTTVDLQWTVPDVVEDPDMSPMATPMMYDIRYSTDPIVTDDDFENAEQYPNPPAPLAPGETQQFTVTGLTPLTEYYFAIKSEDMFGNRSEMSNVVSATTEGAPVLATDPEEMFAEVEAGMQEVQTLNLINVGEGTLVYSFPGYAVQELLNDPFVQHNDPGEFEYMDLAKGEDDPRTGNPVLLGAGGPDGFGYTWIDSNEPGGPIFHWVDISDIGVELTALSGTWDGNTNIDLPFEFQIYDEVWDNITVSVNGWLHFGDFTGLGFSNQPIPSTSDPNNILAVFWDDLDMRTQGTVYVYHDEDNNRFIIQWDDVMKSFASGTSLTFQAILSPEGGVVYQYLDMDADLTSATVGIENSDGTDGLQVVFNAEYVENNLATKINTPWPDWLTVEPASGMIEAGTTEPVTVTFDASGLFGGVEYSGELAIFSNDPSKPDHRVPVAMDVFGGAPEIAVSDDVVDFGTIIEGTSTTHEFTIFNVGEGAALTIDDIEIDNDVFTIVPELPLDDPIYEIFPGFSETIVLQFEAPEVGTFEGTLTIYSNDPETPEYVVELIGQGGEAPVVATDPDEFEKTLEAGVGVETDVLTIYNEGGSDLHFNLNINQTGTSLDFSVAPSNGDFPMGQYEPSTGLPPADGQPTVESTEPVLYMDWLEDAIYYGVEAANDLIVWYQGDTPEVLNTIANYPGTGFSNAGDFPIDDDSFVYEIDNNGVLRTIDIETGDVTQLGTVGSDWTGMATDPADGTFYLSTGTGLYTLDVDALATTPIGNYGIDFMIALAIDGDGILYGYSLQTNNFYSIDKETAQINEIGFIGFDANFGQGMTWDSQHDQIVMAAFNNATFQPEFRIVDRTTGNTQLVGVLGSQVPGGLAQLGWIATPISAVPEWLTAEPMEGTIEPGGSMDIDVTFDATELLGNIDYFANIHVESNDPFTPVHTVPVTLSVTGDAEIAVSDDELDFGSIIEGTSTSLPLEVMNLSDNAALIVSDISIDNDAFSVDMTEFNVFPGMAVGLTVTFEPPVAGTYEGTMTIHSNDPNMPEYQVSLYGEAGEPPVVVTNPDEFDKVMEAGEVETEILTLYNEGGSDLHFNLDIELTGSSLQYTIAPSSGDFPMGQYELSTGLPPVNGQPSVELTEPILYMDWLEEAIYYGVNATPDDIVWFQGDTPEVLNKITDYPGTGFSNAGDFPIDDDSYVYEIDNNGVLRTIDIETGEVTQLGTVGSGWTGMATDPTDGTFYLSTGTDLYTLDVDALSTTHIGNYGLDFMIALAIDGDGILYGYSLQTNTFYSINKETAQITEIGFIGFDANFGQGMTWDSQHDQIVMAAFNNATFQPEFRIVDRTTGNTQLVGVLGSQVPGGLNQLGWIATPLDVDAVPDWLTADPMEGTVAPGGSMEIEVTFNATELLGGVEYYADINVESNDPVTPVHTVPLTLTATGDPQITLSDDHIDFGDIFAGTTITETFTVSNTGNAVLEVTDIYADLDAFTVDVTSFTLVPGASMEVEIMFAPDVPGIYEADLTLENNDADAVITLVGEGNPFLTVEPETLSEELNAGETSMQNLQITNTFDDELPFTVYIRGKEDEEEEMMFYPQLVNEELLRWLEMQEQEGTSESSLMSTKTPSVGADPEGIEGGRTEPSGTSSLPGLLSAMNIAGYAMDAHTDEIVTFDIGVPEEIATLEEDMFTSYAGNFVRGNMDDIVMVNQDDLTLVWYNIPDGEFTEIGELTGAVAEGETFTEMETDYTTGVVYLSSGANLYELNYYTAELTHVGEYGGDYLMIAIAIDDQGMMYGHDIVDDQIVTIDKETAEVTVVGPTGFTANFAQSMTFDHLTRQLLMAAYNVDVPFGQRNELRIVNRSTGAATFIGHFYGDGSGEMGWFATRGEGFVSTNLLAGVLPPDASLTLRVYFNATHLLAGEYEAVIALVGEDLHGEPSVDVPVDLTVIGEPEIWVSDDEFDFGEVFVNGTSGLQYLTIRNDGTDHMHVSNIHIDHEYFHFEGETDFMLAPGEPKLISLWFAPESENGFEGTLTIESDGGDVEVALMGEGIPAPEIAVDPASFEIQAYPGQMQNHTLDLSNVGGNPLDYEIVIGIHNPASSDDYVMLVEEYFDGDFPPEGWERTSTGANMNWRQNNTNRAGGEAPEAEFYWSPSTIALQRLITPAMDTGGIDEVTLEFKHFINNFGTGGDYELRLETSADGGDTWNVIDTWPADNLDATTEIYVLDSEHGVGSDQFHVAWVFDGDSWDINWWNVDDVLIYYELVPWIAVDPMEGMVDPDMTDVIDITIDATEVLPGLYESGLIIHSNDPVNPITFVPFTLNVIESLVVSAMPEEDDEWVHPNEEFIVPINVTSMDYLEVMSYQFSLAFDPEMVEALEVITDGTLSEDAVVAYNIDDEGMVHVAAADDPENLEGGNISAMPTLFAIEGEGTLVYIKFKAQEALGETWLEFTDGMFNEGEPPSSWVDGEVNIVPLYGDVALNLTVNAFDASLVMQHTVGLIELSEVQQVAANVSGGESVTAFDAALILQYVAGLIDEFPVEQQQQLIASDDTELQNVEFIAAPSASGTVSFNGLERSDEYLMIPIQVDDAESVYSLQITVGYDAELVSIEDVRAELPDGWMSNFNAKDGELRVSMAGISELNSGAIGTLLIDIKDETAESMIEGEVVLNEGAPSPIEMSIRDIPEEFKLTQNYPNPFNPVTTIQYQLPQDVRVQLVIYNQLGQVVKTLVDEEQAAGYYRIQWDATNNVGMPVSSGMYIYRLQTGEFTDVKRMIFLK